MTEKVSVPLTKAPRGRRLEVTDIPAGKNRDQLIRLGILKGEFIQCLQKLPGGTMIIEKNRQEIALGVALASTILVRADGKAETRE